MFSRQQSGVTQKILMEPAPAWRSKFRDVEAGKTASHPAGRAVGSHPARKNRVIKKPGRDSGNRIKQL
jgi:hypothetical protein